MWEAARDLGLAKPRIPGDVLLRLMSGGAVGERVRMFPALSEKMENMIVMMANVLIVETFAEDTFNWAQQLLGDPEVSADPEHAAHVVACIARDEVPHVDYLTVALSELRARTLVGADGKTESPAPTSSTACSAGSCAAWPRNDRGWRVIVCAKKSGRPFPTRSARPWSRSDSKTSIPAGRSRIADDEALDVLLTAA